MSRPYRMIPAVRHYLWGGEKLRLLGKTGDVPLAESWELSAREDGMAYAEDGRSLAEIFAEDHPGKGFPLLVKLIDAAKDLSVQVHPDDEAAHALGQPCGKSECWYVLEAEPGARMALGVEGSTDKETLRRAALDGSLTDLLHWVAPKAGECYAIPAGQIHALGAGILVAEVQQNSDTTFRLYDYGRLDADGNPRPLHLEQALRVADLEPKPQEPAVFPEDGSWTLLCGMPSFSLYGGCGPRALPSDGDFSAVMALDDLEFESSGEPFFLRRGQTAYVPDGTDLYLKTGGRCLLICPKEENHG